MLKPETARAILNLVLVLGMIGAVIGVLFVLLIAWQTWSGTTSGMTLGVPAALDLKMADKVYQITWVQLPQSSLPGWAVSAWLAGLGVTCAALFFGYRWARVFVHRLLDDPFDQANVRDLRLGAGLALAGQGVAWAVQAAQWWLVTRGASVQALETAVQGLVGATVANRPHALLSVPFNLQLTPLIIAAVLSLLATVFQRGHDLREAERRLRAEQELTV